MSFMEVPDRKYLVLIVVAAAAVAGVAVYFRFFYGTGAEDRPLFKMQDVAVGKENAEIGENVPVRATVKNVGGAGGVHTVALYVDNQEEESDRVELGPGETSEVSLSFSRFEPGDYRVRVNDRDLGSVRFYVVKPFGPEEPLSGVNWYLEFPDSDGGENAPTEIEISASASSGLRLELYRIRGTELDPIREEWWTETEVDEGKLRAVIGRGSVENQTVALIIEGPDGNVLYKEYRGFEAGRAEIESLFLYRAADDREYEYAFRKIKGESKGDLPVFVAEVRVCIDNEEVDAGLSEKGYVIRGYFPSVRIYSEVEEGPHSVDISFFNERGKNVDALEKRKIFGR